MASERPAVVVGGVLAAIGVVGVMWQYGLTLSLRSGHVPRGLFMALLPIALVAWIVMREKKPGGMGDTAAALWATTRTAMLFLLLLLPGCSLFASGGLTKSKAYLTATKSDLRSLNYAQQAFFDSAGTYTSNLAHLGPFRTSTGVRDPVITASGRSWSATNTHSLLGETKCGIGVNTANPVVPTAEMGETACAPMSLSLDMAPTLFHGMLIAAGLAIGALFGASRPQLR